MFENVGSKVKTLAKVICWIGIIGSIIAGIAVWVSGGRISYSYSSYSYGRSSGGMTFFSGLLTIVIGCFASWIGSLTTYAIGEAAEYAEMNERKLNELIVTVKDMKQSGAQSGNTATASGKTSSPAEPAKTYSPSHSEPVWRCSKCGAANPWTSQVCKDCGKYR